MTHATNVLDRILAARRAEPRPLPFQELLCLVEHAGPVLPVLPALRRPRDAPPRVIAEIKRRSPSAGWIRQNADAVAVARGYHGAGAAMISVLTEQQFFGGSASDLQQVAAEVPLPALRKDFLLDEYDLYLARHLRASAVLLIVRAFPDEGALRGMIACAKSLSMTPLVEAHTRAEALAARAAGADLIGMNHRDLQTLQIDLNLSAALRADLGDEPVLVAESGLRTAADLREMARRGMDAVLIGETLMRAPDPGAALLALLREDPR